MSIIIYKKLPLSLHCIFIYLYFIHMCRTPIIRSNKQMFAYDKSIKVLLLGTEKHFFTLNTQ